MVTHKGGCHCGDVRFEVDAEADLEFHECNCSLCRMTGFLHLIVPSSAFRLLTDESALDCYTFGTHTAKHYFCRRCGVKSFYVPRSNPDGYSANGRCLEYETIRSTTVVAFDGANWEQNAASLAHLSKE